MQDRFTIGHFYLVEWEDSSELTGWKWKDEVKNLTPCQVQTVGICYQLSDTHVTIVLCLGDEGTESEQCSGMICIPLAAIKKTKLLSYSERE